MGASDFSIKTRFTAKDETTPTFRAITNKTNSLQRHIGLVNKATDKFGSCISKTMNKMNFLTNSFIGFFAIDKIKSGFDNTIMRASDLQETIGKTEQTFKSNSLTVMNWAKTSISSMGLAKQTALDTAALYGDMATGMGMSTERAAEMSMKLTQLSADLSSFKNMSQEMTKNALKGVFTGETEALKNLGTVMTQDVLENYAKTLGIKKKFSDMTQQEKIELRFSYVLKSNKNAIGDFLRTGGNYANQKRIFDEQVIELQTRIGEIILPKQNSIMKILNSNISKYSPIIVNQFTNIFNMIISAFKKCKPIFNELNNLFDYLKTYLLPEIIKYSPLFKNLFENIFIPGITLVIKIISGLVHIVGNLYGFITSLYDFLKNNWLPILLILPISIIGVRMAIDMLRVQMALARMEGGLLAIVMNTKLISGITGLTAAVWKSVTALLAQAAAFAVTPIGMITLGVVALVGVVILLWKNWEKITETVNIWWVTTKSTLINFWEKCKEIFGKIGNFIKSNFTDILLMALGPVGMIIKGISFVSAAIIGLKNGEPIKFQFGSNDKNPITSSPIKPENIKNGRIDVGVTIDNKTDYPASSGIDVNSTNGLNLQPA